VYISLLPIGLGAWAPVYAGLKTRRNLWTLLGVLWTAVVVAGYLKSGISKSGHHGSDDLAGFLIILGWVGGIATSFSIWGAYDREINSPLLEASEAGQQRLQERERAQKIARENPALAQEIGIGRPDRAGATDAGLIDINNASVTALLKLPGVDGDVATQIVEGREQVHGFSSLEDMGSALDLDGALIEGLRAHVVFLPRAQPA
jgi:DNA uptake protein ComE-like DNA-binding protein